MSTSRRARAHLQPQRGRIPSRGEAHGLPAITLAPAGVSTRGARHAGCRVRLPPLDASPTQTPARHRSPLRPLMPCSQPRHRSRSPTLARRCGRASGACGCALLHPRQREVTASAPTSGQPAPPCGRHSRAAHVTRPARATQRALHRARSRWRYPLTSVKLREGTARRRGVPPWLRGLMPCVSVSAYLVAAARCVALTAARCAQTPGCSHGPQAATARQGIVRRRTTHAPT